MLVYSVVEMMAQGYQVGAPSQEAEEIDAQVAARLKCRKCGGSMHYEGYHKRGEYAALAVCNRCGHTTSF